MNNYGYFKVACATPNVAISNIEQNVHYILETIQKTKQETQLLVFPELCISGYTCADLFYQELLLAKSKEALHTICMHNSADMLIVVGLPLIEQNHLFNCAAFIYKNTVLGIVPKTYIPNYNEFYEGRWFSSSNQRSCDTITLFGKEIPFTPNLIIQDTFSNANISCDICEDLWVPIPPSTHHTFHGANVIVNLSASNETIGKGEYRRNLIKTHSAKCFCGYVYASAGRDESTTDMAFSGHNLIYDNGHFINESTFENQHLLTYGEIDIAKCQSDRIKFQTSMQAEEKTKYVKISCAIQKKQIPLSLVRQISPYPFVPQNITKRNLRCQEILKIQATGLAQRLKKIHCQRIVLGISGGLDSTLALIVAKEAFAMNGYPTKDIMTITMPGFGTTKRTHKNAISLMKLFQTTMKDIPIKDACMQHFQNIQHDPTLLDITYENTQARERTQILMDLANKYNAIVLGSGDLSELALGWCTYNGDHMSMYAVNASVPKTLVRYLVETYRDEMQSVKKHDIAEILDDICKTPVSPELLPPCDNDEIAQITENAIGSYDYHDFFLYHMLRNNYPPQKIYTLACIAFGADKKDVLKTTMKIFYKRFFTQQFKRSCLPDGVKVGSVCLSPRGDWRMPSDANYEMWLREVDELAFSATDE